MSTFTTTTGPAGLFPDQSFVARDILPEALIYQLTTVAADVDGDAPALRVPFVDSDPTVAFVAEGADITPSEGVLDEVVITTGKLAVISRMSNEAARRMDATTLVADSMANAMVSKADNALLANVSSPTGLFQDSNIVNVGTLTSSSGLSPLIDALAEVEANRGQPSAIVMDPHTWALILKQVSEGALAFGQSQADAAARQLFGVPVVVSPAVPVTVDGVTGDPTGGNLLVVDRSQVISAVGPLRLDVSDQYAFGSDSFARRLTWRIGFGIVRPERLAKLSSTLA